MEAGAAALVPPLCAEATCCARATDHAASGTQGTDHAVHALISHVGMLKMLSITTCIATKYSLQPSLRVWLCSSMS